MTLGLAERQGKLTDVAARRCAAELPASSVFHLLHRERDNLFPDELFADLYHVRGRRSVPPSILAVVMVCQRLEGLSDREAVERFAYDLRWRYAAGVADEELSGFAHTVLVELRARLRASNDPERIFAVTTALARKAGLVGVRRVLDSAPLYDAVATTDTVGLIRSAIRGLLRALPAALEAGVRAELRRDDDYATPGKPACDWDDPYAREDLVDALVRDGYAALVALRGHTLGAPAREAAELLATVVGQDIEERADGSFAIFQGVARERVISVVDPEARHGHKSSAERFDGYKGHVAIDADSEVITAAEVSAASTPDGEVAAALLAPDQPQASAETDDSEESEDADHDVDDHGGKGDDSERTNASDQSEPLRVYGDSAYGSGASLAALAEAGQVAMVKVSVPTAPDGRFAKDWFCVDLDAGRVTCPANVTVAITPRRTGGGVARFGAACASCPLREDCTASASGRSVAIHAEERLLAAARIRQRDTAWRADYRAHRPRVERKLAHLLRRRHGGRRARVRGRLRVGHDWQLLAAAVNLARFAVLGVRSGPTGWQLQPV